MKIPRLLLALSLFVITSRTEAFPEMVRHGYPQCGACHISVTGGGVLSGYGRELSRELLSMSGTKNENESQFAYNVFNLPDWIDAMDLFRSVVVHQSTPFISETKYIFMQNDLELAAHTKKKEFIFDGSIGYTNPPTAEKPSDRVIFRRFYVNWRPKEEYSLRVGRFFPAFGINTPDHIIPIRRDLGWDQGNESYNLEGAYLQENYETFFTLIFPRNDQPKTTREHAVAISADVVLNEKNKLGFSYLYGASSSTIRALSSIWAILSLNKDVFLLSELAVQQTIQDSEKNSFWGLVNYQKLDYEATRGLHFYLTQDYSRLNFSDIRTLHNSFGVGSQFFPRPHFQVDLQWQKLKRTYVGYSYADYVWLMFNYYL